MSQSTPDEAPTAQALPSLVGSWAYVFVGFTAARVLGFLFSVAATRLLPKAEFGELAYALTIAALAAVFLSSAPVGMSRYLTLHRSSRTEQDSYYTNWVFTCALLLTASLVATPAIGWASGLSPWLTAGVAATIIGVAALETSRESQRGADQYFEMAALYVLANLLQLGVVVALGLAGIRSVAVYLIVYGLAPVATLVPMQLLRPVGFHFRPRLLSLTRIIQIFKFCLPLLLQSIGFVVWFGADMVLLRNTAGAEATGDYGAAKTMATVVVMPATALATVLLPRAARFSHADFRTYLIIAGTATAALTVPLALSVSVLGRALVLVVFGAKYENAAPALMIVPFAMAFWGTYQVMAHLWVGRGRPSVDLLCTVAGVTATLVGGVLLVPRWGLVGAALAFTLGSGARLASVIAYSTWTFRSREYAQHVAAEYPARPDNADRPILIIGEEAGGIPDEGYINFLAHIADGLRSIVPVIVDLGGPEQPTAYTQFVERMRTMIAVSRQIRLHHPRAIIFGSRSGVTLMALVRARVLRLAAGSIPVVMIALQGRPLRRPPLWWSRWLFPELLLVGRNADLPAIASRGARVDRIWGGVDLARFRPARPGEKAELRRRWEVQPDLPVVLHVGHLTTARHLEALLALAQRGEVHVIVVASQQRTTDSGRLRRELEHAGVTVIAEYLPNIEELYRLSDCYVFTPTGSEGAVLVPLSVLEALASGVPVASMRFGGLAEHFAAAPGVVLCDSTEELHAAVMQLLATRPTPTLAEQFAWDTVVQRLLALVDALPATRQVEPQRAS